MCKGKRGWIRGCELSLNKLGKFALIVNNVWRVDSVRQEVINETYSNIEREGDGTCHYCPELDIASQGQSVENARGQSREALELFFEAASPEEVKQRLHSEIS